MKSKHRRDQRVESQGLVILILVGLSACLRESCRLVPEFELLNVLACGPLAVPKLFSLGPEASAAGEADDRHQAPGVTTAHL